ncbi:hypothetical protein KKF91_17175 [Myxococcota bacterium]|nr:hypothetical protein [Myxococcota bacterium]MBU1432272.1 hypothetical protein [Myxococcota bacterium]MBU1899790.1 hypothetical protein [Myxococcota bacterium]
MSHPYTLLTLGIFVALVFLGVWLRRLAPQAALNTRAGRLTLLSALMVLLEFGLRAAHTQAEANLWWRLNVFWPLLVLGALDMTFAFTTPKARPRVLWPLAVGGGLIFVGLELSTRWVTQAPIPLAVGWHFGPPGVPALGSLNILWTSGLLFIALLRGHLHMRRAAHYSRAARWAFSLGMLTALLSGVWHSWMVQHPSGLSPRPPALPLGLLVGLGLITLGLFLKERRWIKDCEVAQGEAFAEGVKANLRALERRLKEAVRAREALDVEVETQRATLARGGGLPLDQIISGVAHDLQNAYTALRGSTEMIGLCVGEDDPALKEIKAAIDEGSGYTQLLLTFARVRASRPERVELFARLEAHAATLTRALGAEALRLEGEAPLFIYADPAEVERAVTLLLLLLRDLRAEGAPLRVRVARVGEGAQVIFYHHAEVQGRLTLSPPLDDEEGLAGVCLALAPQGGGLTPRRSATSVEFTLSLTPVEVA